MEFSRKLRLACLQLLMNNFAKFKVNETETVGGVVRISIFKSSGARTQQFLMKFLQNVSYTSTAPNEHFCQVSSELN